MIGQQPNPAHEADTHVRILEAALEEFTKKGYKGSITRAIAERAGVNEVTLFRHFGSKAELLRAAVDHALKKMRTPSDLGEYLRLPLREGLTRLLEECLVQFSSEGDIFLLGIEESFSHPEMIDPLRRFMMGMRTALNRYLETLRQEGRIRGGDYQIVTHMLMSAFQSAPMLRKRAPQDYAGQLTDERLVTALVDTVVRAYGIDSGPGREEKGETT